MRIAAIAIQKELLLLQVGDGSTVVLCANGLFEMPVPRDDENFLNVTTSLSEEDADQKIRHAVLSLDEKSGGCPVAIFLSSDGVDDCFPAYRNEEHLFRFYKVLIETAVRDNTEALYDELAHGVLDEMSAKGSRDDISLGIMMTDDRERLKKACDEIHLPQRKMSDGDAASEEGESC